MPQHAGCRFLPSRCPLIDCSSGHPAYGARKISHVLRVRRAARHKVARHEADGAHGDTPVLPAAVALGALEGLRVLSVPARGQGDWVSQPGLEHRHNPRADRRLSHVPH